MNNISLSTDRDGLISESEGMVGEITTRNLNIIVNNDKKMQN
mgnify:CR=1 FL=1